MLKIPSLERLIHELTRLPGIGPKTAQRLAYYILRSSSEYSERLSNALSEVKTKVHLCPECFSYTDADDTGKCHYCCDPHRQTDVLCVIEEPSAIATIENSGAFRGQYHVLHGALSPLEGVGPNELKIKELMRRIDSRLTEFGSPFGEIVFALDADLEGDTTVLYLTRQLANRGLKLSRIAHGIPIGSDMDYIDDRTMSKALMHRVEL